MLSRSPEHGRGRDWAPELRRVVRDTLAVHGPVDGREERALARILVALDTLPRPFDEHAAPVHVTGSAVVVGRRGTVLHLHKRLQKWMQPGGHVDPGESPWEAALRESSEETGLALVHPPAGPRLIHVDVHEAAEGHEHLDLRYLLLADDDADPSPPVGESPEARWFAWDEAMRVADVPLVGALAVAQRQPEVAVLPGGGR